MADSENARQFNRVKGGMHCAAMSTGETSRHARHEFRTGLANLNAAEAPESMQEAEQYDVY
jgi:hypothetical protein